MYHTDAEARNLLRMVFSPLTSRRERLSYVGRLQELKAQGSLYAEISLHGLSRRMPELFPDGK